MYTTLIMGVQVIAQSCAAELQYSYRCSSEWRRKQTDVYTVAPGGSVLIRYMEHEMESTVQGL